MGTMTGEMKSLLLKGGACRYLGCPTCPALESSTALEGADGSRDNRWGGVELGKAYLQQPYSWPLVSGVRIPGTVPANLVGTSEGRGRG